jgi:para-nitrobenzyl esterase
MARLFLLLTFFASASVGFANPAHAAIDSADVTGGRLHGEVNNGLTAFKGVPFAAPPIADLRWRVPQPVVPWRGTREANTFAPACVQPWWEAPNPSSEDCLYLNVWTAAASAEERLPVMVWIHGGGFKVGMSWEKVSDGSKLAREGVVLVTIGYRLGAFGFLAHPELTRESGKGSGNYGLFDMVAALRWVQANIAQFGGDPTRVTIFGGSAGSIAISQLAIASAAKGLYARAIAQSGSLFLPDPVGDPNLSIATLGTAEQEGQAFFKSLGVSDLTSARRLPAEVIMKALQSHPRSAIALVNIDGDLVQDTNIRLFRQKRFNDTPVLMGFTSDEGGDPPTQTPAAAMQAELGLWPCSDPRVQAATTAVYPHASNAQAHKSIRYLYRDLGEGWPTWTWARMQTQQGHFPAYVYFFDVHGPDHPFGAWHAEDYPFVFGNFPKTPSARNVAVSALMRKYWINFATRGDPNGPGLPVWKRFDERSQSAMVFDQSPATRPLPDLPGLRAIDQILRCTDARHAGM